MTAAELIKSLESISEALQVPLGELDVYYDTRAGGRYPSEGVRIAWFGSVPMVVVTER